MPSAPLQSTAGATQINRPAGQWPSAPPCRALNSGTAVSYAGAREGTDTNVRRTRPATPSPHPFTPRRAFRCTRSKQRTPNLHVRRRRCRRRHALPDCELGRPAGGWCIRELSILHYQFKFLYATDWCIITLTCPAGRLAGNYSTMHHRKFSKNMADADR
jgi:hypothetical protein